jgi:hypothetical protein
MIQLAVGCDHSARFTLKRIAPITKTRRCGGRQFLVASTFDSNRTYEDIPYEKLVTASRMDVQNG